MIALKCGMILVLARFDACQKLGLLLRLDGSGIYVSAMAPAPKAYKGLKGI